MEISAEANPLDADPLGAHPRSAGGTEMPPDAQAGASDASAIAHRGPSLRVRLNTIVATLMVIFVACLGWLRIDATRQSVLEEIVGSNRVAAQLLGRVSWIVASGGSPAMLAFLEQLGRVRANDITLVDGEGQLLYRSPAPTYKQGRSAPAWFSALVAPPSQKKVFAIGEGSMTIEADPSRAILDGWDDLMQLVLAAALGLVAINAVVFWAVGRTVKPLARIVERLEKMQHGDYTARLPPLTGREARLIGESVNRLGEAIEGKVQQRILAHEAQRRLAESREWAQRIEQRLENERRQIATELHNELGQSVTAIRSLAKSLSGRLDPDDLVGREATRLIESEAAHLYDAMHGMIPRLAPLDLDPLGLPEALNELVVTLGRLHPDVRVTLQIHGPDAPVSAAAALVAYRVAQEAVNNAIKHSGGHRIDLVLTRSGPAAMLLTVDDDGCGLPPPDERAARFGLTGLRERILALGGVFDASRRPSGGSRISAQLPLQEPAL
jgi:two-component system sensor histidine kinase UhpB